MDPRSRADYRLLVETSRVWAEIDLDALAHNLDAIRRRIEPDVAIVLVAKADAYGHGAVAIAHHAVRCGVAAIGAMVAVVWAAVGVYLGRTYDRTSLAPTGTQGHQ